MADVSTNVNALVARISDRLARLEPTDPRRKETLLRIGNLIRNKAILNIREQGLIDTGSLLNSIVVEVAVKKGLATIKVGSQRIPYASVHEFGFRGKVQVDQHERTITQVYGRPIAARAITIRAHDRDVNIPARPYLRPAVDDSRVAILRILSNLSE